MKDRTKYIVQTVVFFGVLLLLSCICWLHPAQAYSNSERRALAQLPQASFQAVTSGKYMTDFEQYALDQFPGRDMYRKLKAYVSTYLFRQKDNNGLYVANGQIAKMEYPLNETAIFYASNKFRQVYETYLAQAGSKVYMAIIPDKNAVLGEASGHLRMSYETLYAQMEAKNDYAEFIPIHPLLQQEDYYATDIHWRQEQLIDIANLLAEKMDITLSQAYTVITAEQPFYGVYSGQLAMPIPADTLYYLENDAIKSMTVYDHQNEKEIAVYDMQKADGKDPYELFLGGALSLVTIENPTAETDKELLLFRDSFGSSIAPLLAQGYRKVTLIDIRYIQTASLANYIEFHGQDVLFLYSTSVLNNSSTLK